MTKIAILGAGGRMGRMLLACASELPVEVVCATEVADSPLLDQNVGLVTGLPAFKNLTFTSEWPKDAQVIIDFTFHTAVPGNMQNALANRQAYVLGTTGLTADEQAAVDAAAKEIAILQTPNMSLGVNLLFELVRRAAAILDESYDTEITEMHHRHKKDAPSGTALGLAQAWAEGRGVSLDETAVYGRHGITGERPVGEIGIHALRGGSVVGDHTVVFAAEEERVELTHKASSRASFAKGALKAALWLPGQAPGIYTMRHVLGFA